MSEMVERVARAINPFPFEAWDEEKDTAIPFRIAQLKWLMNEVLEHARTAIAAMREPSIGMIDAVDASVYGLYTCSESSIEGVWKSMIDAALSETSKAV